MELSKEELKEEIDAVKTVLQIHGEQAELNLKGIKVNKFILNLLEKQLEKFK